MAIKHGRVVTDAEAATQPPEIGKTEWNEAHTIENDTIATAHIQDDAITDPKLRESVGVSIMGRSANTAGNPADIAAGSNNTYLGRRADALGFFALQASDIPTHSHVKTDVSDFAHQASHQSGGGDALNGTLDAIAKVTVKKNGGADVGSRTVINLIEGAGTTLTIADNTGVSPNRIDVTITSTPAGGGTLADVKEGGSLVVNDAANLDFAANDFNVTDGTPDADIAINRNAANGIAGLDASGDLAKTEQHPATAYTDAANDFLTNVQTFDKIEIDDTDGTPVADRRLEVIDGLVKTMSTADAEGRHLSRASLELIKDSEVASDAAIAKSKISTSSTFVKADLPSAIAYEDEANDYGTNVQTFDKIEVDDTDGTPVADRRIENTDGLIRSMTTADAEGRFISKASLELITNTEVDNAAAIAYSKLALTGTIVNADVSSSAAIAISKLGATGSEGQVPKISGGVVVWANDNDSGTATTGFVIPSASTTASMNTAMGTTTARKMCLASATTYTAGANTPAFIRADRQEIDGQHATIQCNSSTWTAGYADALVSFNPDGTSQDPPINNTGIQFATVKNLRIDLNGASFNHPHGISNTASADAATTNICPYKFLLIEDILGTDNKDSLDKHFVYIKNMEHGALFRRLYFDNWGSTNANRTACVRLSDIEGNINGNSAIKDCYVALDQYGTGFQADGEIDRLLIHNCRVFDATGSGGQRTTGFLLKPTTSSGKGINRQWHVDQCSVEDLNYGIDINVTSASGGLYGFEVSGFLADFKTDSISTLGDDGVSALAYTDENCPRMIRLQGAGIPTGHIHHSNFTVTFNSTSQKCIGIDVTSLTEDTGSPQIGKVVIDHCTFSRKGSTAGGFMPIRGLENTDYVEVHDCPGYNPLGAITTPWKSGELNNPSDWTFGTTPTISGGSSSPTSGTTYTVRHTMKTITCGGGVITQIAIDGTNTSIAGGSFTLRPGQTIAITYTGSPTFKVYCH